MLCETQASIQKHNTMCLTDSEPGPLGIGVWHASHRPATLLLSWQLNCTLSSFYLQNAGKEVVAAPKAKPEKKKPPPKKEVPKPSESEDEDDDDEDDEEEEEEEEPEDDDDGMLRIITELIRIRTIVNFELGDEVENFLSCCKHWTKKTLESRI